jgi:hypothetical protein
MAKTNKEGADVQEGPRAVRVLVARAVDGVNYDANDVVTLPADLADLLEAGGEADSDEAAVAAARDVFKGRELVHLDEKAKLEAKAAEKK